MSVDTAKTSEALIPLDLVSGSIWYLAALLSRTWQYEFIGSTADNPFNLTGKGVIFCFWHCHIMVIGHAFRNSGVKAMVSQSRDGERISAIAQRWQHGLIRGSSSNSAVAVLRKGVRELESKGNIAITPDGPHGPVRSVKEGCAQIALLAGAPVIPLIVSCERKWVCNSWDGFVIPKIGAKIVVRYGKPLDPFSFKNVEIKTAIREFTRKIQNALEK